MQEPSAGFDASGLSAVFDVPYLKPPAASYTPKPVTADSTSSSSSSGPHPNTSAGPMIGGLLGGLTFGLIGCFAYNYRQRVRRFMTSTKWPFEEVEEIDGQQKVVEEMMAKEICWELPAVEKPIEMWSPINRYSRSSMNKMLPPLPGK